MPHLPCFLFFLPLRRPTSRKRVDLAASTAERGVRGNQTGFCGGNAAEGQLLRTSRARGQCVCGCGLRALTGSADHARAWSHAPARFKMGPRHSLPPRDGRQRNVDLRRPKSTFTALVAIHRCREDTVEDAFFSSELSSAFFPHSGYIPVPDPDPSECDITIDVPWTTGKTMVQMKNWIIEVSQSLPHSGEFKCNAKTSNCATSDRRPVAICVKPGTCE